jgi:hypothetical protein
VLRRRHGGDGVGGGEGVNPGVELGVGEMGAVPVGDSAVGGVSGSLMGWALARSAFNGSSSRRVYGWCGRRLGQLASLRTAAW